MSFNYDTYVGPYVRCVVGAVEVQEERRTCNNSTCAKHGQWAPLDVAFCHLCGTAIDNVPFTVRKHAVDHWDVSEAISERLTTVHGDAYEQWSEENNVHLWKPNVGTEGRDYHLDERADFYLTEITPPQVEEEVARFIRQFVGELKTLYDYYGSAAVTVHWGIIQDYC